MGCDMHAHVEIKVKGQWHHYSFPQVRRDYNMFAALAGVRAEGEDVKPIAADRGIPEDATFTTRFDYEVCWGGAAHSASWISDRECLELEKRFPHVDVWTDIFKDLYLFGNNITTPLIYPSDAAREFAAGYEEARIVFWFDN